jgi:branched-subunit amino acid ABC-type transport system permease component
MAMFTTFLCWVLLTKFGVPLALVLLLSIPIGAALGAAVERLVIAPISNDPPVSLLIVTIGLWIVFNNLAGLIWASTLRVCVAVSAEPDRDFRGARLSLRYRDHHRWRRADGSALRFLRAYPGRHCDARRQHEPPCRAADGN